MAGAGVPMGGEGWGGLPDGGVSALTLLVPLDAAGAIIGRGGRAVRSLSAATRTAIHVQALEELRMGARDRALSVVGKAEGVASAAGRLLRILNAAAEAHDTCVPPQIVSMRVAEALEAGGAETIATDTGAKVRVSKGADGHRPCLVFLSGTKASVALATKAIDGFMEGSPSPRRNRGDSGEYKTPYERAEEDGGEHSRKIMIPHLAVGLLIGKHGVTVRDIIAKSGARVQILGEGELRSGSTMRGAILRGTLPAINRAKELIEETLDSRDDEARAQDADTVALKLSFPRFVVEEVLGDHGVRTVQRMSGALVKVFDSASRSAGDPHSADDARLIVVVGGIEKVENAVQRILASISAAGATPRYMAELGVEASASHGVAAHDMGAGESEWLAGIPLDYASQAGAVPPPAAGMPMPMMGGMPQGYAMAPPHMRVSVPWYSTGAAGAPYVPAMHGAWPYDPRAVAAIQFGADPRVAAEAYAAAAAAAAAYGAPAPWQQHAQMAASAAYPVDTSLRGEGFVASYATAPPSAALPSVAAAIGFGATAGGGYSVTPSRASTTASVAKKAAAAPAAPITRVVGPRTQPRKTPAAPTTAPAPVTTDTPGDAAAARSLGRLRVPRTIPETLSTTSAGASDSPRSVASAAGEPEPVSDAEVAKNCA
mmetsp:Transcript_3795/g.14080  ORF Transcript_3795/g.14080 Transcript_3795/m.14080 type:complete len:657 (-) Transcript_3795:174-2144(-)